MRVVVAMLVVFLATAVVVRDAHAICQINDPSKYACMDLQNNTGRYVTAYWDGNYGCNTAPGTTCSFIVPIGSHRFTARSNDGQVVDFGSGYVNPGCCDDAHRLVVWDQ